MGLLCPEQLPPIIPGVEDFRLRAMEEPQVSHDSPPNEGLASRRQPHHNDDNVITVRACLRISGRCIPLRLCVCRRRSDVEDVLVELLGHLQRGAHRVRGCGAGMGPRGWRARDRRTRPPQFQKYGSTVFCSIGEMWRSTMPSMCLCLLHHFSMCGPTSYRIGPFDTCVERIMSGRVRRSAILGDCERGSARAESERPVS